MPKGKAANPTTDKRRLHLGGRPKSDKVRKTYWATPPQHDRIEKLLHELRAADDEKETETK